MGNASEIKAVNCLINLAFHIYRQGEYETPRQTYCHDMNPILIARTNRSRVLSFRGTSDEKEKQWLHDDSQ